MRKFIALALVAALMLTAIPMAFAAKGDSVTVVSNTYKYYYDVDDVLTASKTTSGAIAYVSHKYSDFINWQVPGNSLTGNAASWGKWIEVKANVAVEGYITGDVVYLNGAAYTFNSSDQVEITFYVLPVEGGNQVTRTLQFYTSDGVTRVGPSFTVAVIYQDIYNIAGSVATTGINQTNTYATIDDGDIYVDVVYKNLIAKMKSTSPTSANYGIVDYYPINVQVLLTDKNGEKYPAFTRVDSVISSDSALTILEIEEVPNSTGICYLTEDSKITFQKRFNPSGTKVNTLDVYLIAAWKYSGLKKSPTVADETRDGIPAAYVLSSSYYANQPFDAEYFLTWSASDLSETANSVKEDAIRAAIDAAINAYYADPENEELYGIYGAGATTPLTRDATILTTAVAFYTSVVGAAPVYTGTAAEVSASVATKLRWISSALSASANTAALRAELAKTGKAGYALTYLDAIADLVATEAASKISNAKVAYRADVQVALNNTLQSNANLYNNELNTISMTLTKPNGEVSKAEFTITYSSVSRIVAKELTTLDPSQKTVTIVKGESVDVAVKAYQDLVPVTGMPIRFTSYDTSIATATDPKSQSGNAANTNTTTITGVNVGTTFVRAYVQSNTYSSSGVANNVEAETIITVNVVEAAPEVEPTPVAPETTDFVCKVRKLWIRDGAGTSNSKLGYFSRNDIAKVIEVVNGWAKIEFNGGVAYASTGDGKYLSPK